MKPSSLPVSSGAWLRANAELRQPRHHHLRHRSAPATSCLAQARVCPVAAGPRPYTHRDDGSSRGSTRSFYVHRMQQISKAAVVHDARAIRVQIGCLKQRAL